MSCARGTFVPLIGVDKQRRGSSGAVAPERAEIQPVTKEHAIAEGIVSSNRNDERMANIRAL